MARSDGPLMTSQNILDLVQSLGIFILSILFVTAR